MSDRLAVFNQGKIEQVGAPADVYENPASPFVASFVGVTNLVSGETARAITGSPLTFSVRPEKIRIVTAETQPSPEEFAVDACVREVVYLGLYTRYIMSLDIGGELIVVQQNLNTTRSEALSVRDQAARLVWLRNANRYLGEAAGASA
jgi:putative spermidine/putrescine transport system ATP-binding protein